MESSLTTAEVAHIFKTIFKPEGNQLNILINKLTKSVAAVCLSLSLVTSVSTSSYAQDVGPLLKPIFLDTCSAAQRKVILKAHANFGRMLDDALNGVTEEGDSVEYLESFGKVDDPGRDFEVLGRVLLLRMGAGLLTMEVGCLPTENAHCKVEVAFVPKQERTATRFLHKIQLCPIFFNAKPAWIKEYIGWSKVSEFQAGTLLHEHTHFSWATKELLAKAGMDAASWAKDQAKAVDTEYGLEQVKTLARDEPEETVLNADSYHVFIMRLAIRKGLIY